MRQLHCEHEGDVARAARTGFWSAALEHHAETCPSCGETRAVTSALLEDSARSNDRPPDAGRAWLEARRRARLHLRRRALFWFRALRAVTCIYLPALLVWVLAHHREAAPVEWKPSFHADFALLLTGPAETFAISGALLAALCITMGSWYLVREARSPFEHSHTR
ncbi:MAG TPA: hypothetical protein VGF88_00715 [Acidobacteriaceae bacterium]|jgi:hypothetical protein